MISDTVTLTFTLVDQAKTYSVCLLCIDVCSFVPIIHITCIYVTYICIHTYMCIYFLYIKYIFYINIYIKSDLMHIL